MAVLQAYQADLLKDLDEREEGEALVASLVESVCHAR